MASFRTVAALSVITGAAILAAMSTATAQTAQPIQTAVSPVATINASFKRCPKTSDQYAEVMKQLTSTAARARALADENPLLEPDAAFYEAELAATLKCAPTIAALQH
jgi:outer membrane murein-binding lipoprotein Lpp